MYRNDHTTSWNNTVRRCKSRRSETGRRYQTAASILRSDHRSLTACYIRSNIKLMASKSDGICIKSVISNKNIPGVSDMMHPKQV